MQFFIFFVFACTPGVLQTCFSAIIAATRARKFFLPFDWWKQRNTFVIFPYSLCPVFSIPVIFIFFLPFFWTWWTLFFMNVLTSAPLNCRNDGEMMWVKRDGVPFASFSLFLGFFSSLSLSFRHVVLHSWNEVSLPDQQVFIQLRFLTFCSCFLLNIVQITDMSGLFSPLSTTRNWIYVIFSCSWRKWSELLLRSEAQRAVFLLHAPGQLLWSLRSRLCQPDSGAMAYRGCSRGGLELLSAF